MKIATKIKKRGADIYKEVALKDISVSSTWYGSFNITTNEPTKRHAIELDARIPDEDPNSDRMYQIIVKWSLAPHEAVELAGKLLRAAERTEPDAYKKTF